MRFAAALALLLAAGIVVPAAAAAQAGSKPPRGLATEALSGESVALLPLTLVVVDPALRGDSAIAALGDRARLLLWADSIVGDAFQGRAPEVNWVLPQRLRQMARRNAGMVPDPDQMGQAILRAPKLTRVPDPLRGSLRSLTAISGGRFAMAPAALGFTRDSVGGFRADLALALADTRRGVVVWRSATFGSGAAPGEALAAAVAAVLPAPGP
ncbi:MAG TPA: hypothetical protein VI297_04515 [Gemmatimonadales bacterium]